MSAIDDRIAGRRRTVTEASARRRLRISVLLLVIALTAGLVGILLRSPWLSVREISVSGARVTDVAGVLESHDVAVGMPTISVDAGALEEALLHEPWVARARVDVAWPGSVEVTLMEHVPAAWVRTDGSWVLATAGGVVLDHGSKPKGAPHVTVPAEVDATRGRVEGKASRAALEFLAALPGELSLDAVVRGDSRALTAKVSGHRVDLGSPREMTRKAAALVALLQTSIEPGAPINLISPQRPAVSQVLQPVIEPVGLPRRGLLE